MKIQTNSKPKKFTSASMHRIEDIKILSRRLHEITGVPVTLSSDDWQFLRDRGKFSVRVPYDETQAFLGDVPVRKMSEKRGKL